jgi:hypothetical protein
MPREKDLLGTIEAQARHVLGLIEVEIVDLEDRLAKLREQHARWSSVLVSSPAPSEGRRARARKDDKTPAEAKTRRRAAAPKPAKPAGPSIDWSEILKGLPSRFSSADIEAATPELAQNPRARIVAVARWSRAKQLKKIAAGQYEKVAERSRKRAEGPSPVTSDAAEPREGEPEHRGPAADSEIESPAA